MNLNDWKAHIEQKIARCKLSWTDRSDPWEGATSWAMHGDKTFSIMMKHDPPAVVICGRNTTPIKATEDVCQEQEKSVQTVTEPESARTALAGLHQALRTRANTAVEQPSVRTVMVQAAFL